MKKIGLFIVFFVLIFTFTACKEKKPQVSSSTPNLESIIDIPKQVFDVNPLTGIEKSDDYPEGVRPFAIMINNAPAAMPQSGISSAPVIYEMVTEGGITRLMAIYDDYTKIGKVGPVRSTRDQFVNFMFPINAIGVHIGSSIYASEILRAYNYITLDGYYLGHTTFEQDKNRTANGYANEHTFYTNASLLQEGLNINSLDVKGGTIKLFNFVNPNEEEKTPLDGSALFITKQLKLILKINLMVYI